MSICFYGCFLSRKYQCIIIAFHSSPNAQERLRYLLDANRNGTINTLEVAQLDEAEHANHMIMLLKAKAYKALQI